MRVFVMGYPGELGGACTELWHTIKLWRQFGIEVILIPTWLSDPKWRAKVEEIGCETHAVKPTELDSIPGLAGSIVVGYLDAVDQAQNLDRLTVRAAAEQEFSSDVIVDGVLGALNQFRPTAP